MTKPASVAQTKPEAADARLIEIFRAGKRTDMSGREVDISPADLADIASRYDASLHEAPLVVGHPSINAPAYGWVEGLEAQGDRLLMRVHQVEPQFADMVNSGRFKKRSASFLLPDAANNPKPGQFYLNHVGFLGATAPAVKGLKDAQFADASETVEFAMNDRRWGFNYASDLFRGMRDYLIEAIGLEKANVVLPDWQISSLKDAAAPDSESMSAYAASIGAEEITSEEDTVTQQQNADFSAREQKMKDDQAALDERARVLADREAKARREDAVAFADSLVTAGKFLPKDKATVVELLLALPTAAPLSFADGDDKIEKPAADLFRALLDAQPKRIDFAEKSGNDGADIGTTDFAAPQGSLVDAEQLELHRKATAYQAQHPTASYIDAVKAVGGR